MNNKLIVQLIYLFFCKKKNYMPMINGLETS